MTPAGPPRVSVSPTRTDNPNDPYYDFVGNNGDVRVPMDGQNSTIYMRIPFDVTDPATVTALTLGVRYDDGFAATINGGPVIASANLPGDGVLDWEAVAGSSHGDSSAIALEPFVINMDDVTLVAGTNILAVHGLNRSANNSDFLFDCELEAQTTPAGGGSELVYMTTPTPGSENGAGVADLGPVVRDVTENPPRPDVAVQAGLLVTAEVTPSKDPVASVTLFHRQSFDAEVPIAMRDDGLVPDATAGDGIYSATIGFAGLAPGEMLRWRVGAEDSDGTVSRAPFFGDPLNSPEYYGTAAVDPSIASNLPVLEWFIQNPGGANNRAGTRASCIYLGEFYDNIFCRVRGGSSAGLSKKSYKFDFNTDHHFRSDPDPDSVRAEEFNLNTTWTDKSYVRQPLTYEVYDMAGSPGSVCFLQRVQQNGAFFSVAAWTEQVDKRLLRREPRLDDDGALYKMFNTGASGTGGVEKKNRRHENNSDLIAFTSGMQSSGATLENFIFDNVDLPRQLNYLAATVLTQNNDNMAKNYYLYRDTEGSGEWTQIPWDVDLTWGSHFMTGDSISHDGIWATADWVLGGRNNNVPISPSHPFVGTQEFPGNRSWNRLIDKLLESDRFRDMFRRRLRTLIDEIFPAPLLDDRIDELVLQLGSDAVADRNRWGAVRPAADAGAGDRRSGGRLPRAAPCAFGNALRQQRRRLHPARRRTGNHRLGHVARLPARHAADQLRRLRGQPALGQPGRGVYRVAKPEYFRGRHERLDVGGRCRIHLLARHDYRGEPQPLRLATRRYLPRARRKPEGRRGSQCRGRLPRADIDPRRDHPAAQWRNGRRYVDDA